MSRYGTPECRQVWLPARRLLDSQVTWLVTVPPVDLPLFSESTRDYTRVPGPVTKWIQMKDPHNPYPTLIYTGNRIRPTSSRRGEETMSVGKPRTGVEEVTTVFVTRNPSTQYLALTSWVTTPDPVQWTSGWTGVSGQDTTVDRPTEVRHEGPRDPIYDSTQGLGALTRAGVVRVKGLEKGSVPRL